MGFIVKVGAHLRGVVVQEIHRFAHFGNGVAEGFSSLAHQNTNQRLHLIFHQHRSALKDRGALLRRGGEPDRRIVHRVIQRQAHFRLAGLTGVADDIPRLGRVDNRRHPGVVHRQLQHRLRLPLLRRAV